MKSLLRNRVFLAGFSLFGFGLQFCIVNVALSIVIPAEWLKTTAKTTPAPEKTETKASNCVSAVGKIWTGVTLHLDSNCNKPFATIMGGNDNRQGKRMVYIRFDSGEMEWKNREAVIDQAYVKSDDPSLKDASLLIIND